MKFIPERDKDEVMFVNAIHYRGTSDTGWNDQLAIIYKDLTTDEKLVKIIDNPEMDIYFTKEEFQNFNYNKDFLPLDQTVEHTVPYKNIEHYIAKTAGGSYQEFFKAMIEQRNFSARKNVHKYPFVFGSDYDIENWIRCQWLLFNDNDQEKPVTKQFLDIEVDSIDVAGFPKPGECPVNAITLIDEKSMESYTFLLRNPRNPQIEEFEKSIEDFKTVLADAFDETYGKINYRFYMYDEDNEDNMLVDLFKLINTLKRDFLLVWNLDFDANFLIARLASLGLDYRDVMSHPDFPIKTAYYKKDKRNFSVQNKSDYFTVSSYTVFLDQMIVYAGLRKGQGEQRSFTLNAIGQKELGDTKLDYSEEANIKTLPYVNYSKFVMYNIKDVLMQLGIERRTEDVNNIYTRAYSNATSYAKIFKQTVFLKNRAYVEYYKQGFIIGNNVNIQHGVFETDAEKKDKKDDKFDGALVADPRLNERMGIEIFGSSSKTVFNSVVDQDFKAMYPNVIISFNISPSTMIGKLVLETTSVGDFVNKVEKLLDNGKIDDLGKDFVDNLLTLNIFNLGTKWFNLPSIEVIHKEADKIFGNPNGKVIKRYVIDKSFIPELKEPIELVLRED